ncbi:hypothetical protein AQUCO_01000725v1 [Aquilegia coerulea]|uniref:Uncharacterized protein n=1 Tax=Aquilegia coerulea TaxID=218851 RepID=A0A2G5EBC0_AQUCA|nr:hypothetical protein AQUCO_01000725v1 [Aquilegia coerulea]
METLKLVSRRKKMLKRIAKAEEIKNCGKLNKKLRLKQLLPKMFYCSYNPRAAPDPVIKTRTIASNGVQLSKEEELKRTQDAGREKRATAAEKRIAEAALNTLRTSKSEPATRAVNDVNCYCCNVSLAGKSTIITITSTAAHHALYPMRCWKMDELMCPVSYIQYKSELL